MPEDLVRDPEDLASEAVAASVRDGLMSGRFAPGQHLVETELMGRLRISRSSLREALRQLEGQGLVTIQRYRGAYICHLTRKEIADLLDVLEQLVILAARLASASHGSKRPLLEVAGALGDARQSVHGHSGYRLRNLFYDRLLAASGNVELLRAVPFIRAELLRAQVRPHVTPDYEAAHAADYLVIARSVADGRGDDAADAVAEHFRMTRRFLASLPDEAFAPA